MSLATTLNTMKLDAARAALTRCCGSARWVDGMLARRPFDGDAAVFAAADAVWASVEPEDWLEAFKHHPRIGDMAALRAKYAAAASAAPGWESGEQAGVAGASDEVLHGLADGNHAYEMKFGWIFLVCATGKSAAEMLALLRARLPNAPEDELRIAAGEQAKITRLRLEKLRAEQEVAAAAKGTATQSPITTHVLDTALGRPAAGVAAILEKQEGSGWSPLGRGATDADGRIRTLLPADTRLVGGMYRLSFDTAEYFRGLGTATFYPWVAITFEVVDGAQHYHVPLLLSPYGYSTYRGS